MSYHHVKIYYGPCDSFLTLSHKPQKLRGIREYLQRRGYRVDLAPVEFENYCVMEMCGHEIFRCNIRNLRFNTPCELDPVAQRAVTAAVVSSQKFQRARSYLWFWTNLNENMFRSDILKDSWSKPLDIEKAVKNRDRPDGCKCSICEILVMKK